jgi:hypothetical protein
LISAATEVTTKGLDRLPALVMDRCLGKSPATLADAVAGLGSTGRTCDVEILTLPRRNFVPRPVTLMAPEFRVAYVALVKALASNLPSGGHSSEAYEQHRAFGVPGDGRTFDDYLVETDIASCHEYIDHARLREELILQSMDVEASTHLVELLSEVHGSPRGLPQLMAASDALADAYLQSMERALLRRGWRVSRYADDFRILAKDWGSATVAIEDAAEAARNLGLVLSTEKTVVRKSSTVQAAIQQEDEFLATYLTNAEGRTEVELLFGDLYEEPSEFDVPEDEADAFRVAMHKLLLDWSNDDNRAERPFGRFLPLALLALRTADLRVNDQILEDVVFRIPILLEGVASYIIARDTEEENWETLARLCKMRRQSPWAKIWLLHTADTLPPQTMTCWVQDVDAWAVQQLTDRHEIVRSEAAWYLAARRDPNLTEDVLSRLYREARVLTRPALASACGRSKLSATKGLAKAITQDTKLVREAFKWGENQGAAD